MREIIALVTKYNYKFLEFHSNPEYEIATNQKSTNPKIKDNIRILINIIILYLNNINCMSNHLTVSNVKTYLKKKVYKYIK